LAGKAASSSSKKRSRDKQRQNAKLGKLTGRTIAAAPIADSHQTDEEEERVDTSKKSKRTPEPKAQPHQQESRSSSGDSAQENRSTAGGSQGLAPRPANQGCSSTSRPTPLSEPNTANFQHDLTQRSLWEQQVYRDHQAYLAARPTTLPSTPLSGRDTGAQPSRSPFLAASPSSLLHRVLTTAKPPSTSLQPATIQSSTTPILSPAPLTSSPPQRPNMLQSAADEPLAPASSVPATQFPQRTRKAKAKAGQAITRQLTEQVELPNNRHPYDYAPHKDKRNPPATSAPRLPVSLPFIPKACHVTLPRIPPTTPVEQAAFDRERDRLFSATGTSPAPPVDAASVLTPPSETEDSSMDEEMDDNQLEGDESDGDTAADGQRTKA